MNYTIQPNNIYEVQICCHLNVSVGQIIDSDFQPLCRLCQRWIDFTESELTGLQGRQFFRKLKRKYKFAYDFYYWLQENTSLHSETWQNEDKQRDIEAIHAYLYERMEAKK